MASTGHPDAYPDKDLIWELNKQREKGEFCDFTIKVCGEEIPAHRSVMVATCGYFRSLYRSGMMESKTNVVELHCGSAEQIRAVVKYMYVGNILLSISDVIGVLKCADFLMLSNLRDLCLDFILMMILESHMQFNHLYLLDLANACNFPDLKKCVVSKLRTSFMTDARKCWSRLISLEGT